MAKVSYKLIRCGRKSIALVIDSDANLIVRAPHKAKVKDITNFIQEKEHWIADKQLQATLAREKHRPLVLENGKHLLYLGTAYTIQKCAVSAVEIAGEHILIPNNYTTADLTAWLKHQAKALIAERVAKYAAIMGARYAAVKISGAKTRWGSCSAKNNLNFTWRLIMAPPSIIDYVVVHELAHIEHKNHGPEFWACVKAAIPDYKVYQAWLKDNRRIMDII